MIRMVTKSGLRTENQYCQFEFYFIKVTTIHTVPIFLAEFAENIFKIYFKTEPFATMKNS